ncbi:DUF2480 family protein [Flavobacterium rakeshii]|uniref:DUF2480 family protein n=1 Tax=Flavobacterium rakeshii TaxID=1038845 RepID=UPI002E7BC8BA|nr:DUF2480 family protein [Flavobacterium rakeshii]MEE1899445.1 DUF2480 family protein [Flavobacterium rakeshii]
MTKNIFINKVEASGIIALDLIDYKPSIIVTEFDIKNLLYMNLIVKEKEFRALLSQMDLTPYQGKAIAFICSVDAIIPQWVYMSLAEKFDGVATYIDFKDKESIIVDLWEENLSKTDLSSYNNQKVVVRAREEVPPALYMAAASLLKPIVKTLMYGEIGMPKVIYKQQ